MFLLDTNIVSETRRARPHKGFLLWLHSAPPTGLFVSVATCVEIQAGIERARTSNLATAEAIERWLEQVLTIYSIIPVDVSIGRAWSKLMHGKSNTISMDALIAATALVHGLTVVTRNTRDFEAFGVPLLDPFQT